MNIRKLFTRKNPDAIANIIRQTAKLNAERLNVGIIDGSAEHMDRQKDGTYKGSGLTIAQVAAINEFGTDRHPTGGNRVPERSFIRASMKKHQGDYVKIFAKHVPPLFFKERSLNKVFTRVGEKAVLDMKHFIKDGKFVPLSPQQIKKKGHAAPLFHTFQMMDEIDYEVRKK